MELYWYTPGKRRKVLETGSELGRGQEGTVFEVLSEPGTVVKVFKADRRKAPDEARREAEERARKLELFVRHPPPNPPDRDDGHRRFAWPERVLFNGAGLCVGYAMPRVCGKPLGAFIYPNQKDGVLAELKLRVAIAREVASIVAEVHLHELSMRLGDVSPTNFLADAKGKVTLIDIDSTEITSPDDGEIYPCPTRTCEYTAPELIGRDLSKIRRTEEHDLFGLSVLETQSLFEGWHPFAMRDGRLVEERIVAGDCPLIRGGAGAPPEAPPFGGGPDFDIGDELRSLLERAFVAGHAEPRLRPRAVEWNRPLLRYEKILGRPVPSVPGPAAPGTRAAPPWLWRRRRAVVAFGGVAAVAASVGLFYVGWPNGDADVEGRVRLASVMDRPGLLRKSVERYRETVTNDAGDLPWGPQDISETPLYWKRVRDGGYEPLAFEIPRYRPWEIKR